MSARSHSPVDVDSASRNLSLALGLSLVLHAVVLSIHFKLPQAINKATENALDVILVNSKSATRPDKAQAKAQANLDGGGNTDEDRRAKTPMPVAPTVQEGSDVVEAKMRVSELEIQQQQMLTQIRSSKAVTTENRRNTPAPTVSPAATGVDHATALLNLAKLERLEGQIARNVEDYNKRPRKKFIGARVVEANYAHYVESWRQKIERIGNLNYPDAAKGRLYGTLVLTVVIRSDGSIDHVEIDRSSGYKVLDTAARRIVEMGAPYAKFPESMLRDADQLVITRTWSFTTSDRLQAQD